MRFVLNLMFFFLVSCHCLKITNWENVTLYLNSSKMPSKSTIQAKILSNSIPMYTVNRDWLDLKTSLVAIVTAFCSDTDQYMYLKFLNTVVLTCDGSAITDWCNEYNAYDVSVCVSSTARAASTFEVFTLLLTVTYTYIDR